MIHNDDSAQEVQECIEKTRQEEDVQELISQEEERYNEAVESDEELKSYLEQLGEEDEYRTNGGADGDMLTAAEDCNVRAGCQYIFRNFRTASGRRPGQKAENGPED